MPASDAKSPKPENDETIHIPGIATPSELITANNHGVTLVKYFPAIAAGEFKTLKDLSRIFPEMFFMPTGGITKSDLHGFAKIKHVASVGGSWMFKNHLNISTQKEMR
jgi:2-dehydro-3-deoxyphosphogluconate aldolase / (4S)-4-hydroxy-2-oxoglutarate aldolase